MERKDWLLHAVIAGYRITDVLSDVQSDRIVVGAEPESNADFAVVLKLLRRSASPGQRERFHRDQQTTQQLQEENSEDRPGGVAELRTILTEADLAETPFEAGLVLKRYPADLRAHLANSLSVKERLQLAIAAAAALRIVHGLRAHRDVKPENFLVDECGRVVITDFGSAGPQRHTQVDVTATGAYPPLTGQYAAPEWRDADFRRRDSTQTDVQQAQRVADLFSLGAVIHDIFAAAPESDDSIEATIVQRIRRLCSCLSSPYADHRLSSAEAVVTHLRMIESALPWAKGLPNESLTLSTIDAPRRVTRRRVLGVTAVTAAAFAGVWKWLRPAGPPPVSISTPVFAAHLNPTNPAQLALLDASGHLCVIDVDDRTIVRHWTHRRLRGGRICWSPDGQCIGVAQRDGRVSCFREAAPTVSGPLHALNGQDIQFSPDSERLAVMSRSGEVTVLSAMTLQPLSHFQIPGHAADAVSHGLGLAWAADCVHLWIAGGGWYDYLSRWNTTSDVTSVLLQQRKHGVTIHRLAASPDTDELAMVWGTRADLYRDGAAFACGLSTLRDSGRHLNEQQLITSALNLTEDVRLSKGTLGLGWGSTGLQVYTDTGIKQIHNGRRSVRGCPEQFVSDIQWAGNRFVGLDRSRSCHVFEQDSFQPARVWSSSRHLTPHVTSIAPTNTGFCCVCSSGQVMTYDGSNFAQFTSEASQLSLCAVSAPTSMVAYRTEAGSVVLQGLHDSSGRLHQQFESDVSALQWSPDGQRLAIGRQDGTVTIMAVANGQFATEIEYRDDDSRDDRRVMAINWIDQRNLLFSRAQNYGDPAHYHLSTDGEVFPMETRSESGWSASVGTVARFRRLTDGGMVVGSHYGIVGYWPTIESPPIRLQTGAKYTAIIAVHETNEGAILCAAADGSVWRWKIGEDQTERLMSVADGVDLAHSTYDRSQDCLVLCDQLGRVSHHDSHSGKLLRARDTGIFEPTAFVLLQSGEHIVAGTTGDILVLDNRLEQQKKLSLES